MQRFDRLALMSVIILNVDTPCIPTVNREERTDRWILTGTTYASGSALTVTRSRESRR